MEPVLDFPQTTDFPVVSNEGKEVQRYFDPTNTTASVFVSDGTCVNRSIMETI